MTGTKEFMEFINNSEPTDFLKLFKLFQKLPAFGKLTAYLLAADYATAGKATIPSCADMGFVIGQIDAGGLVGLRKLGWANLNHKDKSAIAHTFESVYLELKSRIPPHRLQQMDFNVFLVEHSLCKHERLDIQCFRNILA
jgi:hypothetical protein